MYYLNIVYEPNEDVQICYVYNILPRYNVEPYDIGDYIFEHWDNDYCFCIDLNKICMVVTSYAIWPRYHVELYSYRSLFHLQF